jgi:hypothetical protein
VSHEGEASQVAKGAGDGGGGGGGPERSRRTVSTAKCNEM